MIDAYLTGLYAGGYWALLGTVYLIFMTWQDLTHNMMVDDRYNFLMLGLTVSLYSHFHWGLVYSLSLFAIVLTMSWLLSRFHIVGDADVSTVRWVFWGFGIISPFIVVYWLVALVLCWTVWVATRVIILKAPAYTRLPFYPVLLSSFFLANFMFGMYY